MSSLADRKRVLAELLEGRKGPIRFSDHIKAAGPICSSALASSAWKAWFRSSWMRSGEETGERPFLYVVKENKVFVDDGNPDSVAATAYREIRTARKCADRILTNNQIMNDSFATLAVVAPMNRWN